jgi:hypothetical protein
MKNQTDGINNESYYAQSSGHLLEWINKAPGEFCVRDISPKFEYQYIYTEKCEYLVGAGILERVGRKRGWYRVVKSDCEELNFLEADDEPADIWMPLRLSDYVQFHYGNLIVIAGAPNSGKTAFMLNIVKENMLKDWDVHYFTSEMEAGELKLRLSKFPDISLDRWNFKAYRRGGDFQDVIKPGRNSLNIVDFLEVHDEFYIIARRLKEIHDKLQGGIAVVGLQKNPGSDVGLGGWRSMEVTRLALALDFGKCKITKAKNWVDKDKNPNGWIMDFKLVNGCQIIASQKGWYRDAKQ